MDCERVQAAISERMDGEHLAADLGREVDDHYAACPECRAFAARAERLRAAVRLEPAEPVPDLVGAIMASVATKERTVTAPVRVSRHPDESRRPRRGLATVAAALVVGLVVGSLLVGGPLPRDVPGRPAEAGIAERILSRAQHVTDFRARYRVTERNYPGFDRREFRMRVWFSAPERFALEVQDRNDAPGDVAGYTRNDLTYVVNRTRSLTIGPTACPPTLEAGCPQERAVWTERPPFSARTPVTTDLVLPLGTIASGGGVRKLEERVVLNRPAVRIELPFERAAPMLPFLTLGGRWRPFYAGDTVSIWLDARELFPLSVDVLAAQTRDRRDWELRHSLPREHAARPVLSVQALDVSEEPVGPGPFRIARPAAGSSKHPPSGASQSEGARTLTEAQITQSLSGAAGRAGEASGLELYRAAGVSDGATEQVIVAYSEGVTWLKVTESHDWRGPDPLGVDRFAEEVALRGGGVGYFQPGSAGAGRRLSLHTGDTDLVLEPNLPREQLLAVAGRLPVRPEPLPRGWRVRRTGGVTTERVALKDALARLDFRPRLPSTGSLPGGVAVAAAELTTEDGVTGLTVYYRSAAYSPGGRQIRVHVEPAGGLSPPSSTAKRVRVDGTRGRWSPEASLLEWNGPDGLSYTIAIDVDPTDPGARSDVDRAQLMRLAAAMEPA